MAKSNDEYEYASSSQKREMRSESKLRKLRAELEQYGASEKRRAGQARKAKGRGAGGAALCAIGGAGTGARRKWGATGLYMERDGT